jgi:hypothetical protein
VDVSSKKTNFAAKLKDRMKRNMGCSGNIMYSCVQNSCDALPIEVEALVKKIHKYITSTLRVTEVL